MLSHNRILNTENCIWDKRKATFFLTSDDRWPKEFILKSSKTGKEITVKYLSSETIYGMTNYQYVPKNENLYFRIVIKTY